MNILENKINTDKSLQPSENSILNDTFSEMNLYELINQAKNEIGWQSSDRIVQTIFKSDAMSIVLVGLHKNAMLKPHHANGAITVQVIEGAIHFKTEQKTSLIEKGNMIALKEKIEHSVEALKDSFFLLTKIN